MAAGLSERPAKSVGLRPAAAEPLSILELRGRGKDPWAGKGAAARLAEERRSWD